MPALKPRHFSPTVERRRDTLAYRRHFRPVSRSLRLAVYALRPGEIIAPPVRRYPGQCEQSNTWSTQSLHPSLKQDLKASGEWRCRGVLARDARSQAERGSKWIVGDAKLGALLTLDGHETAVHSVAFPIRLTIASVSMIKQSTVDHKIMNQSSKGHADESLRRLLADAICWRARNDKTVRLWACDGKD